MWRTAVRAVAIALMSTITPLVAAAQKTVVRREPTETATAVIERIDVANRFVLLRGDDGEDLGVFAPPEFARIGELRVGDRVTITYHQSTVYQLKGRRAPRSVVSDAATATESASRLPGATLSRQQTERVTVKSVDRKTASITVTGSAGQTVTRHVHNLSDLDGVKKGDRIDITYTQAVLVTVTRAK